MHRRTACRIGERPRGNSETAWLQHTREKDFFVAFSYVPTTGSECHNLLGGDCLPNLEGIAHVSSAQTWWGCRA